MQRKKKFQPVPPPYTVPNNMKLARRALSPPKQQPAMFTTIPGAANRRMFDSPVMRRRARKKSPSPLVTSGTPPLDSQVQRSANMAQETLEESAEAILTPEPPPPEEEESKAAEALFGTCERYLKKNSVGSKSVESFPTEEKTEVSGEAEKSEVADADKVAEAKKSLTASASLGTLPKPKLSRKNSRSFVPKMRRVFERAKSLEPPETMQIRFRVNMAPPPKRRAMTPPEIVGGNGSDESNRDSFKSDGTESVSSFVAVSNPSIEDEISSNSKLEMCTCPEYPESTSGSGKAKKSFVHKCMSKVKNIFHAEPEPIPAKD